MKRLKSKRVSSKATSHPVEDVKAVQRCHPRRPRFYAAIRSSGSVRNFAYAVKAVGEEKENEEA